MANKYLSINPKNIVHVVGFDEHQSRELSRNFFVIEFSDKHCCARRERDTWNNFHAPLGHRSLHCKGFTTSRAHSEAIYWRICETGYDRFDAIQRSFNLSEFFFVYCAGQFYGLSVNTRIDVDDCVGLTPAGILHLSVTKDIYHYLGLEGKLSAFANKHPNRYCKYFKYVLIFVSFGVVCVCVFLVW